MAKIKAPLFSLDATGTLDKNITYKGLKQKHIAQKYSQPGAKNPFESSPRQKDQRSIIRLITIHWQCMSSADKLSWENAAKDVRFKGTGYHYFLHMAQQNLTQYLGLVGYWSMNYNIDDKIPDLSGNGNDGILSPIYPCDCPTLVDSFDKKRGKAISFDGINDYLSVSDSPSLTLSLPFTVLFWLKITAGFVTTLTIFRKGHNYGSFLYTNEALYAIYHDGISWRMSNSGYFLPINKWVHVSITFVANLLNTDVTFYISGNKFGITVNTIGHPTNNFSPLGIGSAEHGSLYLPGLMDDTSIYNLELSPEEIKLISST